MHVVETPPGDSPSWTALTQTPAVYRELCVCSVLLLALPMWMAGRNEPADDFAIASATTAFAESTVVRRLARVHAGTREGAQQGALAIAWVIAGVINVVLWGCDERLSWEWRMVQAGAAWFTAWLVVRRLAVQWSARLLCASAGAPVYVSRAGSAPEVARVLAGHGEAPCEWFMLRFAPEYARECATGDAHKDD